MNYFHGSSSASFEGVFDDKEGGLIATGELLKTGRVPFSGELAAGISEFGINTHSISTVGAEGIRDAVRYALSTTPWTPEIGQENLDEYQMRLRGLDESSRWYPIYKTWIELEEKRLNRWRNIPAKFQAVISNPFPVIFKILHPEEGTLTRQVGIIPSQEIGVSTHARIESLVIYVPTDRLDLTRELGSNLIKPEQIKTFEELSREILGLSLQTNFEVSRLLNWQ